METTGTEKLMKSLREVPLIGFMLKSTAKNKTLDKIIAQAKEEKVKPYVILLSTIRYGMKRSKETNEASDLWAYALLLEAYDRFPEMEVAGGPDDKEAFFVAAACICMDPEKPADFYKKTVADKTE